MEVERGADAKHHGRKLQLHRTTVAASMHPVATEQPGHQPFLFWRAETDPDAMRAKLIPVVHQGMLFLFGEGAKRRRPRSNDLGVWKTLLESLPQCFGYPRTTSVEEMTQPILLTVGEDLEHQVRPVDAIHFRPAYAL